MNINKQFNTLLWLRWKLFLSENRQKLTLKISSVTMISIILVFSFFSLGFGTGYILNSLVEQNPNSILKKTDWIQFPILLISGMMLLSIISKFQYSKEIFYGVLKKIIIFPVYNSILSIFILFFSFFNLHNIILLVTALGFITGIGLINKSYFIYLLFGGVVVVNYMCFVILVELTYEVIRKLMVLSKNKIMILYIVLSVFIISLIQNIFGIQLYKIILENNPVVHLLNTIYSYLYSFQSNNTQVYLLFLIALLEALSLVIFYVYFNKNKSKTLFMPVKISKDKIILPNLMNYDEISPHKHSKKAVFFFLAKEIKILLRAKSMHISFVYIFLFIVLFNWQLHGWGLMIALLSLLSTFMLTIGSNVFGFDKYALFVTINGKFNLTQLLVKKNITIIIFNTIFFTVVIVVFKNLIHQFALVFIQTSIFFYLLGTLLGNHSSINSAYPFERKDIKQKNPLNNNHFIIMLLLLGLMFFGVFVEKYIELLAVIIGIMNIGLIVTYHIIMNNYKNNEHINIEKIYFGLKKNA